MTETERRALLMTLLARLETKVRPMSTGHDPEDMVSWYCIEQEIIKLSREEVPS